MRTLSALTITYHAYRAHDGTRMRAEWLLLLATP